MGKWQKTVTIPDGRQFLAIEHVTALTGRSRPTVLSATRAGTLVPARVGSRPIYTATDVRRWQDRSREHAIARRLEAGEHPIDIYLESGGEYSLEEVTSAMHAWARLTGAWVVEGPRGSYARWLARFGLIRLTPRQMRRVIEALLADPYVHRIANEAVERVTRRIGKAG